MALYVQLRGPHNEPYLTLELPEFCPTVAILDSLPSEVEQHFTPGRAGEIWDTEKTARVLAEDGQRRMLEQFGLWPAPARR